MPVLEVRDVRKKYKEVDAVAGVSFVVQPGEIVGLLGPNGAGKTTTISMILGVLEPTSGSILIDGTDIAKDRSSALAKTNFAAVYAQLPGNLTVMQNLRVFGMLYGATSLSQKIDEVVAQFGLEKHAHSRVGVLSSGEQTRATLAKAFLSSPTLLLLDEPSASLDPVSARMIREHIVHYASQPGHGVLWTSHNMHEVVEVCTRVLFMSHGKILLQGDPKTLPQENGKANLEELFVAVAHEKLDV